jgi:hypothetical protein
MQLKIWTMDIEWNGTNIVCSLENIFVDRTINVFVKETIICNFLGALQIPEFLKFSTNIY